MASRDYLGEFEHIVLLAVLRLDDQGYGVTVRREIEARTKREVSIGAIYATLDRLEAKGYVRSRVEIRLRNEAGDRSASFALPLKECRPSIVRDALSSASPKGSNF